MPCLLKRVMFVYLFRCASLVLALAGGGASAEEREHVVTLLGPATDVTLVIERGVQEHVAPALGSLTLYVDYPSGKSVKGVAFPRPSTMRVLVRPISPGGTTRTEGLVKRALPQRPLQPGGREWLVHESGGIRVFAHRTRSGEEPETHAFLGSDGSLVGVRRGHGVFHMNEASRRYQQRLEILYQYPRELDERALDEFLLDFLRKSVSVQ
jgi:hypothetical protein